MKRKILYKKIKIKTDNEKEERLLT